MIFFICFLCLVAGIAIGVGFSQVVCSGMIHDNNQMWINALVEMDKIDKQATENETTVYENVTVFANDNEVTWQRQDNTVEMSYEEWENKHITKNT